MVLTPNRCTFVLTLCCLLFLQFCAFFVLFFDFFGAKIEKLALHSAIERSSSDQQIENLFNWIECMEEKKKIVGKKKESVDKSMQQFECELILRACLEPRANSQPITVMFSCCMLHVSRSIAGKSWILLWLFELLLELICLHFVAWQLNARMNDKTNKRINE